MVESFNRMNIEKRDNLGTFFKKISLYFFSVLWWFSLLSTITFVYITCYKVRIAYNHHVDIINSAKPFVEKVCSNHTFVVETRSYAMCEVYIKAYNMDPFLESLYEVFGEMDFCDDGGSFIKSVHDSHDHLGEVSQSHSKAAHISEKGRDGSIFSCKNVYYMFIGGIIVGLFFLFLFRSLLNREWNREFKRERSETIDLGTQHMGMREGIFDFCAEDYLKKDKTH